MTPCACPECACAGDEWLDGLCALCAVHCVFPAVWRGVNTREEREFVLAAIGLFRWRTHALAEGAEDHGMSPERYVMLHRHHPDEVRRVRLVLAADRALSHTFQRIAEDARGSP